MDLYIHLSLSLEIYWCMKLDTRKFRDMDRPRKTALGSTKNGDPEVLSVDPW